MRDKDKSNKVDIEQGPLFILDDTHLIEKELAIKKAWLCSGKQVWVILIPLPISIFYEHVRSQTEKLSPMRS